jgi:hypothetical protein
MSAIKPDWAPRRLKDLVGMEVTTRREMRNGYIVIPANSRVQVYSATAWHKIHIVGQKCDCCGVQPVMQRVHIADLAPICS